MRFLVAVDGSKPSEVALEHALEIAEAVDASVDVVHVVRPEIYSEDGRTLIEDMSEAEERSERVLDAALRLTEDVGFEGEVSTQSLYGDVSGEIVDYSEAYDVVYVGHRGESERSRGELGGVAGDVVRRSPVSVTVVR
ncbi:MAG: universal stress protein [Halobacteriota archaeon]